MSGTPSYWRDALGDKNKGPLTDEDIDIIAEAKEKDPAFAQEVFATLYLGNKAAAEDTEDASLTLSTWQQSHSDPPSSRSCLTKMNLPRRVSPPYCVIMTYNIGQKMNIFLGVLIYNMDSL